MLWYSPRGNVEINCHGCIWLGAYLLNLFSSCTNCIICIYSEVNYIGPLWQFFLLMLNKLVKDMIRIAQIYLVYHLYKFLDQFTPLIVIMRLLTSSLQYCNMQYDGLLLETNQLQLLLSATAWVGMGAFNYFYITYYCAISEFLGAI